MRPDRNFERQLSSLDHESTVIANYVYAEMAIQHAASKSRRLLNRLNTTPTFWIACGAAFQSGAYISLGRVFDLKSPYNVSELLASMEIDLDLFSRDQLAKRKRESGLTDEAQLAEYVAAAYVPTNADIRLLQRSVKRHRVIYERAIMPVRHQYLAHRQAHGQARVSNLYARGKLKEMWRLSAYLIRLHQALWNLLHNGRKPSLRLSRYSPRAMYDRPSHASAAHERMVQDTKKLMRFLESATPNNALERAVKHRGPRLARQSGRRAAAQLNR